MRTINSPDHLCSDPFGSKLLRPVMEGLGQGGDEVFEVLEELRNLHPHTWWKGRERDRGQEEEGGGKEVVSSFQINAQTNVQVWLYSETSL